MDFIDNFLKRLAIKLLKYASNNYYIINPKMSKQLLYELIYNLKLIVLESFKIYI